MNPEPVNAYKDFIAPVAVRFGIMKKPFDLIFM